MLLGSTANRTAYTSRIQRYFAKHFSQSPKCTWHLTWPEGKCPNLQFLAGVAETISNSIEISISEGRLASHQCTLFSRSLFGAIAASFPDYVQQQPDSKRGCRHGLRTALGFYKKMDVDVFTMVMVALGSPREYHRTFELKQWLTWMPETYHTGAVVGPPDEQTTTYTLMKSQNLPPPIKHYSQAPSTTLDYPSVDIRKLQSLVAQF